MDPVGYFCSEITLDILLRNEDDAPSHRALSRHWKVWIDQEYGRTLRAFSLDVPSSRAVEVYLRVKQFMEGRFSRIYTELPQFPRCFPFRILKAGFGESSPKLRDLLRLDEIMEKGQEVCQTTPRLEAEAQAQLFAEVIKRFNHLFKNESAEIVQTILLKRYSDLTCAIEVRNVPAIHHFLYGAADSSLQTLERSFFLCTQDSSLPIFRVLEKIIEKNPLFEGQSNFMHALGHLARRERWALRVIQSIEGKYNKVGQGLEKRMLHAVVKGQNVEDVQRLVKAGADVNQQDCALSTPLMEAARSGNYKICSFLLEEGASLTIKDIWGFTAMDWCAISGRYNLLVLCKKYPHNPVDFQHAMVLFNQKRKDFTPEQELQVLFEALMF